MRFEKRRIRRKRNPKKEKLEKRKIRKKENSKKEELENPFAIKFRKIILTAILKKELYIIRRFFRKRLTESVNAKIYKSQLKQFISFKFQRQQTFKFFFKRLSLQILLKIINVKKQNIQISQISIAKFINRLRIIRYLYKNHLNVEFSHIVQDIYKVVIDYFNNINSNIENYIYCFFF